MSKDMEMLLRTTYFGTMMMMVSRTVVMMMVSRSIITMMVVRTQLPVPLVHSG